MPAVFGSIGVILVEIERFIQSQNRIDVVFRVLTRRIDDLTDIQLRIQRQTVRTRVRSAPLVIN